jgi:hypothetical protein
MKDPVVSISHVDFYNEGSEKALPNGDLFMAMHASPSYSTHAILLHHKTVMQLYTKRRIRS